MAKTTIILLIIGLFVLYGCSEKVKVTIVPRSVDEMVSLKIFEPSEDVVLESDSVKIEFELKNFKIGGENAIAFVLDNGPRILHHSTAPFYLAGLSEGRHTIRAFPVKVGESVKDASAFAIAQFFVKKKNTNLVNFNLPTLTYNSPAGFYRGEEKKRVLLDFLVSNVLLDKKGYKVVYTLDNVSHTLDAVSPIYLTNLLPGEHSLMLELVDKSGNLAEGNFVRTQHNFVVADDKK